MDNNCIHCSKPNPERWFYCRGCGERASEKKFSTNMWMMSEAGKRTDIEFRGMTMDEHIKEAEEVRNASR